MPDVMTVEMPVDGAQETRKAFQEAANQAERLANATERIDRIMKRSGAPIGPYGRRDAAQGALAQAQAYGAGGSYLRDLEYKAAQAQKAVDRLKPQSFGQRLGSAVASSRFGLGNLSPLVGKAAGVIGGEAGIAAMSNPYVAAGLLVLEGAKQVAAAIKKVADDTAAFGNEFANNRTLAGTDAAGAAALRSLGISGERSRALMERISSDPAAAGVAGGFGAYAQPGPYGTLDSTRSTLKIIEGLRRQSPDQQLRSLRILGAEDLAPKLKITDETFQKLKNDARITAGIAIPDFERKSAEYTTAQDRLKQATENLEVAFGSKLLPAISEVTGKLADLTNWIAERVNNGGKFAQDALNLFSGGPGALTGGWLGNAAADALQGKNGAAGADADKSAASVSSSFDDVGDAASRLVKKFNDAADGLPKDLTGPNNRGDALVSGRERGALRLGVVL